MGEVWDTLLGGKARKDIILLEGSQFSLAHPSAKTYMKAKTSECLEILASDSGRGILIFWINAKLPNSEKQFGGFHSKEAWFWWI
jgi:hypothetical protein